MCGLDWKGGNDAAVSLALSLLLKRSANPGVATPSLAMNDGGACPPMSQKMSRAVGRLGKPVGWVLPAVALIFGGWVVYRRASESRA